MCNEKEICRSIKRAINISIPVNCYSNSKTLFMIQYNTLICKHSLLFIIFFITGDGYRVREFILIRIPALISDIIKFEPPYDKKVRGRPVTGIITQCHANINNHMKKYHARYSTCNKHTKFI